MHVGQFYCSAGVWAYDIQWSAVVHACLRHPPGSSQEGAAPRSQHAAHQVLLNKRRGENRSKSSILHPRPACSFWSLEGMGHFSILHLLTTGTMRLQARKEAREFRLLQKNSMMRAELDALEGRPVRYPTPSLQQR